jgi:hypothetical protein
MSNSSFQILIALNKQLATMADLPSLVFYEDSFDTTIPSSNQTFLVAHDMPTGVNSPVMAAGGYEEDSGIYQVSIFTPKAGNAIAAKKLADNIKAVFGRSELLDAGTSKLRFRKVEAGSGGNENGNHYMLPVSIYWSVVG